MKWLDTTQLKQWAQRKDAKVLLSQMVSDLIRASVKDFTRFRFPSGDAGEVRGFDGHLICHEKTNFVPEGESVWEFGITPGFAKAENDYNKRTASTPVDERAKKTFVMVNLTSWNTPKKNLVNWVDAAKAKDGWFDIHYMDGPVLESWLEEHPAVAAKYARDVLRTAPKNGAISTDEFWNRYSRRFKPYLVEEVVLCERDAEKEELLRNLAGTPHSHMIGAESSDEVVAFAVAAIRTASPKERFFLEARTMIVETEDAARDLSTKPNLSFIVHKGAEEMVGVLSENGPTLSAATGVQARRYTMLTRPTASGMGQALSKMMGNDDGYELAHRCGRSITVLMRQISNGPAVDPNWKNDAAIIKPAFLAGGWKSSTLKDKEALQLLANIEKYEDFEYALLQKLSLTDPPVDRIADVWKVRAPVDAFPFYGRLINANDLLSLKETVLKVFSHKPVRPDRDQLFSLSSATSDDYSDWLREGLALTLLIFSTMHELGGLQIQGKSPQQYVDEVVSNLPDFGRTHESMIALRDQMALLAEAAPSPFLAALESMLEGHGDEIKKLFTPSDSIFSPTSPHVYVLWSLEVLAWDPKYLPQVLVILAKMAELDPYTDTNQGNRPIASIRSILLSWSPNTHAPLKYRLVCLGIVLDKVPAAAWDIVTKLLPRSHDSATPTQKPKLRDTSPVKKEELTFGLVWDSENAVVTHAVRLAKDNEERIINLIESLSNLQPQNRAQTLELIEHHLEAHPSPEGNPVWHSLNDETGRHEYFSGSDWAMATEEVASLKIILEKYRPTDVVALERQLFDDWTPHVARDGLDIMESIQAHRLSSLQRIWDAEGAKGVVRLAQSVKLPNLVAQPLMQMGLNVSELYWIFLLCLEDKSLFNNFTITVSAIGRLKFEKEWGQIFQSEIVPRCESSEDVATLLANWPMEMQTWQFVERLGSEIEQQYWGRNGSLPFKGPLPDLEYAISKLLEAGQSNVVIANLYDRSKDLSGEVLLKLLDQALPKYSNGQNVQSMVAYNIGKIFDALDLKSDVTDEQIAQREYVYLPLLEQEKRVLKLHHMMALDPTFYVDVLAHIFRKNNDDSTGEPTIADRNRAKISYDLISSFKTIPGLHEDSFNLKELFDWISATRKKASEMDRAKIADQYIGHLIAHAPLDPVTESWPHQVICEVLEMLEGDDVELGIAIERFNMRGAHWRPLNGGGDQERELANTYRRWADAVPHYQRAYGMLNRIADDWEEHAKGEDLRSEQGKLKR